MNKKRKRTTDSDCSKTKKKKIDDKINIDNVPRDIKFLISSPESKVLKCSPLNRSSWRDQDDASIQNFDEDEEIRQPVIKLPPSIKSKKNKLLPQREYQNSTNIDPTQKLWGNTLNRNKHIINIIPNGLHNTLPTQTTLEIALKSCLTDHKKIQEERKKIIKPVSNKQQVQKDVIVNKIELLGIDNIYYKFDTRLSKGTVNSTLIEYSDITRKLRSKFFSETQDENSSLLTDIGKSSLWKQLEDLYKKKYDEYYSQSSVSSLELRQSIPVLTREYLKSFRFPPINNERKCIKEKTCLFFTFQSFESNKGQKYIGREFLLPNDLAIFKKTGKSPEIRGPCIDCLLYDWFSRVYTEVMQRNIVPENPINTFRVKVEEKEYNENICLPQTFRDNQPTGICGFVPGYGSHLRDYIEEIKIEENGEKSVVTYLAEINTDFRLSLVK
jgi:hypothetical protein